MALPVVAQSFEPDFLAGCAAYDRKDYATVLKHWRPLAKQGHADAQLYLGVMYRLGYAVTKDYKQAVRWFRKAANQGSHGAQWSLGEMYEEGHGVVQDLVMAYVWLNVAIANGGSRELDRNVAQAKLNVLELRLGRKLSKRCFKKPAKCPEYSDD